MDAGPDNPPPIAPESFGSGGALDVSSDVARGGSVWAAPASPTDLPRTTRGLVAPVHERERSPGTAARPGSGSAPLAGSPVARLQPRTVGQLLDGGFDVIKFRFRNIAVVTATLILPLYALPAMLSAGTANGAISSNPLSMLSGQNSLVNRSGELTGAYWRLVFLGALAQIGMFVARLLLGVGIAHMVTSWMLGRDPGVKETLRHVAKRLPIALAAWLVLAPVKVASAMVCGLGLIYTLPVFAVLAPVVSIEGSGPFRSIARTHRLSLRRFGPVLGIWALWMLVSMATGAASSLLVTLVTYLVDGLGWGWVITGSVTVALNSIWVAVEVAVWVLVYIDIRVRTEGIDIRFEAIEQFDLANA